jgi:hypothetical protein
MKNIFRRIKAITTTITALSIVACSTTPTARQLYTGQRLPVKQVATLRSACVLQGDKTCTFLESVDGATATDPDVMPSIQLHPGRHACVEILPGRHTLVTHGAEFEAVIERVLDTGVSTTPDLGASPYTMTRISPGKIQLGHSAAPFDPREKSIRLRIDDKRLARFWKAEKDRNRRTICFEAEAGKSYVIRAEKDKIGQLTGRAIWVDEVPNSR